MNRHDDILFGLPGEILIREGLADVNEGRDTIAGCLVEMVLPRLKTAGISPLPAVRSLLDSEHRLYGHLAEFGNGAYARYNSLLRELTSFRRALEHRMVRGLV
ncbi:MAG: hypothetical protein O3A92_09365 [Verrucomicrobia bacterium]|nr:hypothetical protein [Verrucomicrobiota bacterium]